MEQLTLEAEVELEVIEHLDQYLFVEIQHIQLQ